MKVCVPYSDSHERFLKESFLQTFPFEFGVSLVIQRLPQLCSGELFADGWRKQMIEKQRFINSCMNYSAPGEILLFSDVDVRFYGPIEKDLIRSLGDRDICFMKDHNSDATGRCGGFFVLKSSEGTKNFFSKVLSRLESHTEKDVSWGTSEQSTINNLLSENKDIHWGYLPPKYYTHGLYTHGIKSFSEENQAGLWWENKSNEEKQGAFVPNDILVHHANWAHGVEQKLHLLNFVSQIVAARTQSGNPAPVGRR